MVPAASSLFAPSVLPAARSVASCTVVGATRVVVVADTVAPFTILPVMIFVPAANVLPLATSAGLATETLPAMVVEPIMVRPRTRELPPAIDVSVVSMLPAPRLLAVTTLVSLFRTAPDAIATPLITLPAATKLPAPRILPAAMVVAAPICELLQKALPVSNELPAAIVLPPLSEETMTIGVFEGSVVVA